MSPRYYSLTVLVFGLIGVHARSNHVQINDKVVVSHVKICLISFQFISCREELAHSVIIIGHWKVINLLFNSTGALSG